MRPTATVCQALVTTARPAALAVIAAALAVVGSLSVGIDSAHAQPVIEVEGACDPSPVRPNEPALISCTVRITNAGDETATSLVGDIFIADDCAIPSRFSFIDRTVDGELVAVGPFDLSVEIGDLAPGDSTESVTRIAAEHFAPGRSGGALTVRSLDNPALNAVIDLCWDVDASAAAPPANLIVTKTLVDVSFPLLPLPIDVLPVPEPPPPPVVTSGFEPLPRPVPPPGADEVTYEIVVTNVSDVEMAGVTLLDAQLGGAVLAGAEPPATGADPLDRPIWELGTLAAGDEASVLVTFGAPPDGDCANADDVAIVSTTPAGGEREEYLAFADLGGPVGPCQFVQPNFCLYYPPGEGFPTGAPCEIDVCWAESPDGGELRSVVDCTAGVDYCWFLPPGEGFTALRPCADDVCWVSFHASFEDELFDGPGEYLSEFPCEIDFCQFTAPDGSFSTRSECDFPVCWTVPPGSSEYQTQYDCTGTTDYCWFSPPGAGRPEILPCAEEVCWLSFGEGDFYFAGPCEGGRSLCQFAAPDGSATTTEGCDFPVCWSTPPEGGVSQQIYGCGEFETWCWFSPPAESGGSILSPCDFPLRFAVNPPPDAIVIGSETFPLDKEGAVCWPIPLSDGPFATFPLPCDLVEFISWFTPPDGGPKMPGVGLLGSCLEPLPPDIEIPPGTVVPPDLVITAPCLIDDGPGIGEPGTSIPADVVDGVSTPAEIVPGTVEEIAPLPSVSVTPAEIVPGTVEVLETLRSAEIIPAVLLPSSRVEQVEGPAILPVDEGEIPRGPGDSPDGDNIIADTTSPEETGVKTLPDTGTGGVRGNSGAWPAAFGLAAAVALAATLGIAIRQRGRL